MSYLTIEINVMICQQWFRSLHERFSMLHRQRDFIRNYYVVPFVFTHHQRNRFILLHYLILVIRNSLENTRENIRKAPLFNLNEEN